MKFCFKECCKDVVKTCKIRRLKVVQFEYQSTGTIIKRMLCKLVLYLPDPVSLELKSIDFGASVSLVRFFQCLK